MALERPVTMFTHIEIERRESIGVVWLNRPDKHNALSRDMWTDLPAAVRELSGDQTIRVIVVAARGSAFTVGIDLAMLGSLAPEGTSDVDRRMRLYQSIRDLQETFTSLAECPQPVIAAIHGYCLGAGIDLITACDIRMASADAIFSVRETAMGLVADVGTMQRLPLILSPGHVAELVYTGADIDAVRAAEIGLVNRVYPNQGELLDGTFELATRIAANSPLAVQGAKAVLRAGEGRTVAEGLDYVALWNAAFLISDDLGEALAAFSEKRSPNFKGQ